MRLYSVAGAILGVIGGLCLANALLAILVPELLLALGLTTARTSGQARWLWPGFLFCGLLFGGLAVWFGAAVRKVRRLVANGFLLAADPNGLSAAEFGTVPWPAISGVTAVWRPLRARPAASPGGVIGQRVGRHLTTSSGQDGMFRQLNVSLRDGRSLLTSAAAMAEDAQFGRFLQALGARLQAYGIPYEIRRD